MYEEEGSYTYFLRMGGKLVCQLLKIGKNYHTYIIGTIFLNVRSLLVLEKYS
jgi:hypothetical protein